MPKAQKTALFDMDYTIIAYDTLIPFAGFVVRRQPWRLYYIAVFLPACALFLAGLIGRGGLKRAFLSVLWRMKADELDAIARAFAENVAAGLLYPEVIEEVKQCKARGLRTVLNTASPEFYVRHIAEIAGFDEIVGTRVRIDPVMPFLPVIEGENNRGIEKILRMPELVPGQTMESIRGNYPALSRDPAAFQTDPFVEIAYTDSSADLPLLVSAELGVLVHPSKELAERGKRTGWRILRPPRPYGGKIEKYVRLCLCLVGLLKLK